MPSMQQTRGEHGVYKYHHPAQRIDFEESYKGMAITALGWGLNVMQKSNAVLEHVHISLALYLSHIEPIWKGSYGT